MFDRNRRLRCGATSLVSVALATVVTLATVAARPLLGQSHAQRQGLVVSLDANDLLTLVARCGAAEPREQSLDIVRNYACSRGRFGEGEILAFEENRWFVYALADMSHGATSASGERPHPAARQLRRVLLLKPSTLVVEDVVRSQSPQLSVRWMLRCVAEPKIEAGRFRVTEANHEIVGETAIPDDATLKTVTRPGRDDRPAGHAVQVTSMRGSNESRFLHALHLERNAGNDAPIRPKVAWNNDRMELMVTVQERVFRLTLPTTGPTAGTIEISEADAGPLVPTRLLPSGVMPHGPEGARLMERWDAPYRREQLPGWDVGRPCSHLVKAVQDKTFPPGRAMVLGCGSGTNAIYLASKGFEVTGVDVSPAALSIAARKARTADVEVDWILADVVALPKLPPYDLVFDRGCYHHICQYDSPAYVETLRRLSHAGTRAMILAGSPADGRNGGPPRIKEETVRNDFSTLFDFQWLRNIHFDSRDPNAQGPSAWSIHLRRKSD